MKKGYKYILTLILAILIAGSLYAISIKNVLEEEALDSLSYTSELASLYLDTSFKVKINLLNAISNEVVEDINYTKYSLDFVLPESTHALEFSNVIVNNGSTTVYASNLFIINTDDIYNEMKYSNKNVYVTVVNDLDIDLVVISVPIKNKRGDFIGVISGVVSVDDLVTVVDPEVFKDKKVAMMVNSDGNIIYDFKHGANIQYNNVYTDLSNKFVSNADIDKVKYHISNSISATFDLRINNEDHYSSIISLDSLPWVFVTSIKESVVLNEIYKIISLTLLSVSALVVIFILLLIVVFTFYSNRNKEFEKEKYYEDKNYTNGMEYLSDKGSILIKNDNFKYALLSIQISKLNVFKEVFGSVLTDRLLKYTFKILNDDSDLDNEIVVNTKNDLFIYLAKYDNINELKGRLKNLNRLYKIFEEQLNNEFEILLNIGAYLIEDRNEDINSICDKAIIARKQSKANVAKFTVYDANLKNRILKVKELENKMRSALENNEFKVFYQPKVSLKDYSLHSVESLVRWIKDGKIISSPAEFIPLFEQNGFILELDLHIFERVCSDLAECRLLKLKVPKVSINLSRLHFYNIDFINKYLKIIEEYDLTTDCFILEITEYIIFDNMVNLQQIVSILKEKGFTVSMDDFGSGYSSLKLLNSIDVDEIKLDAEFLKDNVSNKKGKIIINKIIKMCNELGINTVCEGVETSEQYDYLKSINCNYAQGFYVDIPMSFDNFINNYLYDKKSRLKK